MNGKFYFLDTNAIIQLLKGNEELFEMLQEAELVVCSVISKIEFLSFSNISKYDIELFNAFAKKIEIMELPSHDSQLLGHILNIRKDSKLKLPDAIIAGCSVYRKCSLITADKKILKAVGVTTVAYQVK